MPLAPGELPPTVVDTIVDSLRATGARPPRQLWLPPLEKPATADELVRLVRGKPWDVDYGKTPGLAFPVGIEDRPRQHRQDVHFLDLLGANALVIGGPQSGVTTTLATMMTTAALMYRPGARAVLLRGRGRSEPRRRRWAAARRGPRPCGGPRGRRPHHRLGAGHRRRARSGVRQDRAGHGRGPAPQVQRQAGAGAGGRRRRHPRHRRLGDVRRPSTRSTSTTSSRWRAA